MNEGVVVWFRSLAATRHGLFGLLAAVSIALALLAYFIVRPEGSQVVVGAPVAEIPAALAPKLPRLVVTFRDAPPDMVVYSKGRFSGPLRYVLEEAADRIGYSVQWREAGISKSVEGTAYGSVDVIPYFHYKTAERETILRFSVSLGKVPTVANFMQHADDPRVIKTLADLAGMTVGHRAASFYFTEFMAAKHFKRLPVDDNRGLVRAFDGRLVDTIVLNNKVETERALATVGIRSDKVKYTDLAVRGTADLYAVYSRAPGRQELFDRLDQAILEMKKEGLINDIYRSFDADPPK